MSRMPLPDAQTLATLITNVTNTMCGISFAPVDRAPETPLLWWRIATLTIGTKKALQVTLSSDRPGCEALGAALFGCPREALDVEMIDDSLRELLNMASGQIKNALSLEEALGLPQIVPSGAPIPHSPGPPGVVLRSQGDIDIVIRVAESPTTLLSPVTDR